MGSNAKTCSCNPSTTYTFYYKSESWFPPRYTTIAGQDLTKPLPYDPADPIPDQVRSSFQRSLSNLRTTYLDSYILHSPLDTVERTQEAWRILMALQDEGKVHKIGISNAYDVTLLKALGTERPVQVVQNRWFERNKWDKDVCSYCRENNIQYQFVGLPSIWWLLTMCDIQVFLDAIGVTGAPCQPWSDLNCWTCRVYSTTSIIPNCPAAGHHSALRYYKRTAYERRCGC